MRTSSKTTPLASYLDLLQYPNSHLIARLYYIPFLSLIIFAPWEYEHLKMKDSVYLLQGDTPQYRKHPVHIRYSRNVC